MSWCQIAGIGGFYNTRSERAYVTGVKRQRLSAISPFRRPLGPNAEAPNLTVTLDNGDGSLTAVFEHGPLLAEVTIGIGAEIVSIGLIEEISIGAEIVLQVQA